MNREKRGGLVMNERELNACESPANKTKNRYSGPKCEKAMLEKPYFSSSASFSRGIPVCMVCMRRT